MNLSPGLLVATAPPSHNRAAHGARATAVAQPPLFPASGMRPLGRGAAVLGRKAGSLLRWLAVALLPLLVWLASAGVSGASANEVAWSLGVQMPGAVVQVGQAPRVVVNPHPQVVYPQVAYPVYSPYPRYPAYPSYPAHPIYQPPQPVYQVVQPQRWDNDRYDGRQRHWHHRHHHQNGRFDDDRGHHGRHR